MQNKFGFILVKPQLGENIGACARSMKNFGFNRLHIVEPKINFPNHKAKATSVGAYDIINKAKVFDNVEDSINSFNLIDGIDGNAALIGIISFICFAILFWIVDNTPFFGLSVLLIGMLMAYLPINFSKNKKGFMVKHQLKKLKNY